MYARAFAGRSAVPPIAAFLVAALGAESALYAQLSPHGPEFQINSLTTDNQTHPSAAMDEHGGFVVAWASYASSVGDDSSSFSIQGQRFSSNGSPVGAQFQINTYTTSSQDYPAVARDDQGGFVVVWRSTGSSFDDTLDWSIQGQRFAWNGAPLGLQFQVNTYTTGWQSHPFVAMDGQGRFVVVWQSTGSSGSDLEGDSVQGRLYGSDGSPRGSEFQINTYTTSDQERPSAAMGGDGTFVVVWASDGSSGDDDWYGSIQGQRFDPNGDPVGVEFEINAYTTNGQTSPSVAIDDLGNFVVVWASYGSSGTDSAMYSIQGQLYDSAGGSVGLQFQVNTYTTSSQFDPAVSMSGMGEFVAVWQSAGSGGGDTLDTSIQGQRFAADGGPNGAQFQVNSYTTNTQRYPSVAVDGPGDFVVAWFSLGSGGDDASGGSIQGQLYDALFRDGFESGGLSRWLTSQP